MQFCQWELCLKLLQGLLVGQTEDRKSDLDLSLVQLRFTTKKNSMTPIDLECSPDTQKMPHLSNPIK